MSTHQDPILTEMSQHVSLGMLRTAQQENLCKQLALDLLACGAARFERSGPTDIPDHPPLVEFCFRHIRYSAPKLGTPWAPLITNIGLAECQAHLPKY